MKPVKKILTMAVAGAAGVMTFNLGSALVKDVQFARAEAQVTETRENLGTLGDLAAAFKNVNKVMEKSVVQFQVTKNARNGLRRMPQFDDETLRKFFDRDNDGEPDVPEENFQERATGSGVIMDAADGEAFILTNNHVVSDASEIEVVLEDGRHISDAKVVGADPKSDLAVVKIKADRVITAKWGDSDKVEKGDIVLAFGSPFGYVGSMSHGIVSATNRQAGVISGQFAYENFIQVDAPINPGNSGGPLVSLNGQVIGINTAIASRTGSFAGIGFAIPSNQAKNVYETLKSSGKIVRGYLGVGIADVRGAMGDVRDSVESLGYSGDTGVFVREVRRDGPANKVLQAGDIITEIDGKPVATMVELRNRIASITPGKEVKLTVWRDKKTETLSVTLAEQPDEQSLAAGKLGIPNGGVGVQLAPPTADELEAAGLPSTTKGALVKGVRQNSLAARVGIQNGDLITRIGDQDITNAEDARAAFAKADLAKGVRVNIINRDGEKMVTVRQPAGK